MKNWTLKIITGSGVLMMAMMLSNVLNLLFNIYVGRKVDLDDFSTVTIINTLWYFISIFISALSSTLVQRIAFLTAKYNADAAHFFFKETRKRAVIVVSLITFFYICLTPILQIFFHLSSSYILLLVAPSLVLGTISSLNRNYLHANLYFPLVAALYLLETVAKFIIAAFLIWVGKDDWVFLAIPFSVFITGIASFVLLFFKSTNVSEKHSYRFPKRFYIAALLSGLSGNAFLVYDISLAKHFLTPHLAGEYALLSLVGKMIYFMGSLVNTFMLVFISRDMGANRNPNKTFYLLMSGIIMLVSTSALFLSLFGKFFIPLFFGKNTYLILPYIEQYSVTIAAFTIANAVVGYHLARKHYVFPVVAIIISLAMIVGIFAHHKGIADIVNVMYITSLFNLALMILLHLIQMNGGFFIRNVIDMISVVLPLPKSLPLKNGKRILIFNWRDTKHAYAGGAEVYIHELAKRWVKKGHAVTLFCGNDGHSPRDEEVDGVYVVRRGGFYMVYFWAFFYYMLRFRRQYDVIIDCENGLPFFTPLYAREKKFLVIHHVHQDVFRKSLSPIFSSLATMLEIKIMPMIYKNIKVITVSPSSKKEILEQELTMVEPTVIYSGIDLKTYKPGLKNFNPLVVYIGRLKYYKSIDVFIKAAKRILEKMPTAEFVIAGEGEEKKNLIELVQSLHLDGKIQFLGRVTEEEKIRLYQKAWVAVNPSMMEGWGITVIEANACGTPVVASKVPGLMDSVKNPHTGYLVKHGNDEQFAEKIFELLSDEEKRTAFSQEAIKWANNFDWDTSAEESLKLFEEEV